MAQRKPKAPPWSFATSRRGIERARLHGITVHVKPTVPAHSAKRPALVRTGPVAGNKPENWYISGGTTQSFMDQYVPLSNARRTQRRELRG